MNVSLIPRIACKLSLPVEGLQRTCLSFHALPVSFAGRSVPVEGLQ
jgi:hypothetical protein